MRLFVAIIIFTGICTCFFSCNTINVYEKNKTIKNNSWISRDIVKDSFQITDTISYYDMYVTLRHTDAYAYNNIWLNAGMQHPGDSMYFRKLNLTLGNDANGWKGTGMDDIWELREKINNTPFRFRKKGIYRFSIQQVMREDSLKGIMSVGMRLQKREQ